MHGNDPVDWLIWQESTLKQAKAENKIIMISSGYFSCHWCHVMHKESYKNTDIANYLNEHFISVKIDRELTPDLDKYLINFARKSAGHAGWPQHVFLTPEGYPFFAFTYKPQAELLLSLKKIQAVWQESYEEVTNTARQAIAVIKQPTQQNVTLSTNEFTELFLQQLEPRMDMLSGGLRGSNKFPNEPILKATLLMPTISEEVNEWLLITLDQMQSEHLFDHVYGGFYRYTIDPEWQIPHFEKMLYNQAQLAEIYLIAGKKYNRADYLATAKKTLDYVQNKLFDKTTGLYLGSQSAVDINLIEAADYVWAQQQLKLVLSPKHYAQVTKDWLKKNPPKYEIPINNVKQPAWHPRPTSKYWQDIRKVLADNDLKPYNQIPTDTKSILGWNGLLLSAFAKAVELEQMQPAVAHNLAASLIKQLNQVKPPRAISNTNQPMGQANIQDYAYIVQGLTDWAKVANNLKYQQQAITFKEQANKKFLTAQGWLYSNSPLLPGQTGVWAIKDSHIPSPTAILECAKNTQLSNAQQLLISRPFSYPSYVQTLLNCNK